MRVSKLVKIILLCLFLSWAEVYAFAPRYFFDVWTNENGLPQNNVKAILQTRDGYLWLTTLDGLVRYDGVRFVTFTSGNTKGILTNRFSSLFEDREGSLWIGTEDAGVIRYKDNSFQTFLMKDGLPDDSIRNLLNDANGDLIAATKAGLARWNGAKFEPLRFRNQPEDINAVIFQGQGRSLLTVKNEILIRLSDTSESETIRLPENFIRDDVLTLFEDSKRNIWVAQKDGKIFCWKNSNWIVYDKRNNIPEKPLKTIYEDSKSVLWFGSEDGGLYRFADNAFTVYTTADGLPENHVIAVYEDREGTIWLGTNTGGFARLNPQIISVISKRDGLTGDSVYPIYEDREGNIWIGASGLNKIDTKQKITTFTEGKELYHGNVLSIYEDSAGRFWFGAVGGINLFQNGKLTDFSSKTGLPVKNFNTWAIKEDKNGRVWFGTDRGLLSFKDDEIKRYTTENGLPSNDIKMIFEARDGSLWFATYGGLSRLNADNSFTSFTEREGLASNKLRSLYEDGDGVFWIGSYDGGLTRMKDGKFTRYTMNEGLASNGVFQILEDDKGYFWISSNQGISRVSKTELNDFADGKIKKVTTLMFGKRDGLLNAECNGGTQPAGIKKRDGRLLFPTQGGIAIIDPNALQTNSFAPPVLIESALIDRENVPLSQGIEISPRQSNLEIAYTGLSFIKPERVKFKYKLEGLDADWTDAETRRAAYYAHLPPGSYTFRVIAANSDGVWNETGASIRVTVYPPFWRTWWFLSLVVLSIAGLVVFIYQRRVSHLKREQEAQVIFTRKLIDAQEQERKRIAAELHDGLGQNLLIIKNWALLAIQKKKDEDTPLLEEISSTASQAIEETRAIAYNLRPYQIDEIGITKAIEGMLKRVDAASSIRFTHKIENVDGLFPKELEINLFRIVQECVNNIIKHSKATEASVNLECGDDSLLLTIEDDGRGFDVSTNGHKKGLGLTGLQERARMLGGELMIQSEQGKGTKMVFKFNFSR